jgi:hypothetical protein
MMTIMICSGIAARPAFYQIGRLGGDPLPDVSRSLTMRFLLGVIIGIAITIGAALLHDNNVPQRTVPRSSEQLAQLPIVDWDVLGQVGREQLATVGRWWDRLLGRDDSQRP